MKFLNISLIICVVLAGWGELKNKIKFLKILEKKKLIKAEYILECAKCEKFIMKRKKN
jgi:hypothetical protein